MMVLEYITDLFANKNILDNRFIVLHIFNPKIYLIEVYLDNNNGIIYNYNINNIHNLLLQYNLDPSAYDILGSIWVPDTTNNEINILLVNIYDNITLASSDYVAIKKLDNLTIWKPINQDKNYIPLGYVASIDKPNYNVQLIHKSFIKQYQNSNIQSNIITNMNEYNLLTTDSNTRVTLNIELINASTIISEQSYNTPLGININETIYEDINDIEVETNSNNHINNIYAIGHIVKLVESNNPWFKNIEPFDNSTIQNSQISIEHNKQNKGRQFFNVQNIAIIIILVILVYCLIRSRTKK